MDTTDRVRKVLRQSLVRRGSIITPATLLVDDLGMTNLERFETLMNLESEFDCELEEEELVLARTVQDLTDLMDAHSQTH